jgi:integrase
MAGGRNKLAPKKVELCFEPGHLNDGGNLYLQIALRASLKADGKAKPKKTDRVTKSWVFRYRNRSTKKLVELGLGSFPDVSLEEAREKAAGLRAILRGKKDPKTEIAAQRAEAKAAEAKTITFDEAAAKCIAGKFPGWNNSKHAQQWTNTLKTYASPVLGSLPVNIIDLALIRKVLDPIWATKNETASRVRQRMESVLSWAKVSGYCSGENPARWRGHLDQLYAKPSLVQNRKHFDAMEWKKLPKFMKDLRSQNGIASLALEFTILTAARTGMTVGATWKEFDLEDGLWTVPEERMKAKKEHLIPLSKRALKIIKDLEQAKEGPFVFPGAKDGKHLSTGGMDAVLKRMKCTDADVHGFRSTFRDWAADTKKFEREVVEHALAHQLKDKAEAAYQRSTMLQKRKKLMNAWDAYCSTE